MQQSKEKKLKIELKNEHGICRVYVVRSILMGLMYGRKYSKINSKISDCQMEMNGIIHDVQKYQKMKPFFLGRQDP